MPVRAGFSSFGNISRSVERNIMDAMTLPGAKKELPWAETTGPVYHAQEIKPRKESTKTLCWLMCGFLIVGGLMTPYKLIILFALLYMLVLLMKKDMVVTERGVETFYQMRITTWYEKLEWKDIDMVVREDRDDPRLVALYFRERGNDDRVKRLFFTREDAQSIMRMAKLQPDRIEVCEADKKSGHKSASKEYYKTGVRAGKKNMKL